MEINRGTESGSNRGNDLPVRYLRLLAPPLQLLSAAVWQVVQQGLVEHYGMLEEFVTMVTELVPELMSYSQRAQLILGLRARLVLEMCRGEHPVDMQTIQPHLDRIKAPVSTAKDHHVTINQVEESEVNFVELVHSLLEGPSERKYFFEEIFPEYFGPKYNAALEMLVWEFISRLDELLPVPDFTQLASLLGDAPSFLDDCLQSLFPPEDMKAVLEHHRNLGHFKEKDPRLLPMDDCILASLSLPPGTRPVMSTTSCSPALKDPASPEPKGHVDGLINTSTLERPSKRSSETIKQSLKESRDSSIWQQQIRGGNISQERKGPHPVNTQPCDETIDLTMSNETADPDSADNEDSQSLRETQIYRKRKLSGGVDIPTKQPVEASAFLDSSADDENSDSQEGSFPVVTDTKVPWSDEETLHLLDIWGKDSVQRALKGCLKNRHIFTQIAQKMAERGYMRTVEQCQTRIKRLKKCFRQNNKGNARLEYKIYEQLERVFSSSAPSSVPEVTYNVEEVIDQEESQDGDDDLQFVGLTSPLEIGTRSVPWTDWETLALINMWGEDKMQQELRGTHRTGHVFSIISKSMVAQGFSRTPEQCQTRLKRLKSSFRQCYQNNLKGQEQVVCKFYNELGRILVKDFPIVPQLEDIPAQVEDGDFPAYSHREIEPAVGIQEDRKKVPWSDKETIILLELWGDPQVQQNLRRYPHNGHVFTDISEKLNANGYSRSAEQCHSRIKRLKANYRQCQENMSSSGTDRVDFKFYDLLEQILDKQPSTSTTLVTDSIEISEESNDESVAETDGEMSVSIEKPAPSSWSDEETLALIDIWGNEDVQRALRGFVHNGHVYADISERMRDLGYLKTSEQCRWKVKSLRNNFRQCYDRKKCGRKVDYRFYNQLEQILGQEAVSIDQYDERDERADQDPGVDGMNTPWTEEETVALVEVWAADDVQTSLKTFVRNGHVFVDISEKMAAMGYLRTAEQCHSRIKRLKKTYRRHCNNQRSGGRPAVFRYYNLLAPVLGDGPVCTDMNSTADETTLQPLIDKDSDTYEQSSSNHLMADLSRKMPWSDQETRTLLEIWGDNNIQLTLRGCLKNRHVFEYISEKMSEHGFMRTSEQCYTRIKRLKYSFLHEKEEFKFFSEMDRIFRKELKVDDSVADMTLTEELDDCTPEPGQKKGNQWVPDCLKLAWSDGETEALLDIWGSEEIQENLKSCTKNKHIFIQISQVMASQGYLRTPEQCQTRIKRLRANFRSFLEGRKGEKQECKYFDQLVQIFGSKYVMNSDPLTDDTADVVET
ncbi:TIN2_N and Myb_DNA-bind_4 domain-containing protein isoform X2 [Anabas testudineus]|uniref:TIN2_N and Myb_DNA-bind_4 domain-containing protein isoform X2 n=1 Tax=Anabas testudineus TaxID=64144 RepID=UPI000E46054D|nr:TIN2_N and Myb_DNA-bind_4 domain-containing protein isoform X2 [Anabas testudineus]